MRAAGLLAIGLVCLGACAAPPTVVQPTERGSSRADGIVAMTSISSPYQPVQPDWSDAATTADRRCRSWGQDRPQLAGWREACRVWDRWGRCTLSRVTRFYDCQG
jgi:hypothetical protein